LVFPIILPIFGQGIEIENLPQSLEERLFTRLNEQLSKFEEEIAVQSRINVKLEEELEERVAKLEELTKVATLRSCSEYADFGLRATGFYLIDPDGPLIGNAPFQVLCNFTTGSTEVLHDAGSLTSVEHCHDPGCYEKEVTYVNGDTNEPIPLSQIIALIQLSDYCDQAFYYECTLAPLQDEDINFAFWTDRHGEKNVYFTGSNKGFHSCDCQFTDEGCFEHESRANTCNCDANLPTPLSDSGTITNTTALPVTRLAFGGLTYEIQAGAFKLGNMRCFGKTETEIGSSCSALKLKGTTISGYYDIKKPGDPYTSLVYCDMDEDGYENISESVQTERSSPLGTIAAWVAKPENDASQEQIPNGWVMCNNSLIEKGPWMGARTPNLNNGNFLRGGEVDQQLEFEDDQVQDHLHTDPGHVHPASSSSSPHTHGFSDNYIKGTNGDYNYYCFDRHCADGDSPTPHESNTQGESASVSTTVYSHATGISGVTSAYRSGSETWPRNMKTSFIMKCW